MKKLITLSLVVFSCGVFAKDKTTAEKSNEPSVPAKVFFTNLKEGQTIPTDYKVQFVVEGMALRKAGEDVNDKKSGHHHILINQGPVAEGQVIPADADHLHFGQAQTEAVLKLKPGHYTITLQLADGAHRSFGEKLSSSVKVTVK